MMKRILTAMCALLLLAAGCTPALAAEAPAAKSEPEQSCYYPIKVEEYTSGPLDELRTGEVAKTDCQIVTYTATFGSMKDPGDSSASEIDDSDNPSDSANPDESSVPFNWTEVKTPVMIGGMVLILVFGGAFALKKFRRR